MLIRTGAEQEIELGLTVTPLGAVARLEHALGSFEDERRGTESRLRDAERRLGSYRSRTGESFAFGEELAAKWAELAEVEKALAAGRSGPARAMTPPRCATPWRRTSSPQATASSGLRPKRVSRGRFGAIRRLLGSGRSRRPRQDGGLMKVVGLLRRAAPPTIGGCLTSPSKAKFK